MLTRPFYFSSIRNLTAAFGSLFKNIHVQRFNTDGSLEKDIKVPLAYAAADKTVIMLQQQDVQRREDYIDIKTSLPRMSFEITGMAYDPSRKTQTAIKNVYVPPAPLTFDSSTAVNVTDNTISVLSGLATGRAISYTNGSGTSIGGLTTSTIYYAIRVDTNTIKLATTKENAIAGTAINLTSAGVGTHSLKSTYTEQFNAVPYNFDFTVYIFVKYIDDGLQIIEQIVPYFTPFYAVTLNDLSIYGVKRDVPITLTSVSSQDLYEGAVEDDRILQWTLTFTANSWIYPPVSDVSVIKTANTNFYEFNRTQIIVTTTVAIDPITADEDDDDYEITTTITEY